MNTENRLAVCIVEDEPRLRELLVREIRAMGHDAVGFRTAEDAWPSLESGDHHAAILDLNLPGDDGMTLFRRLREGKHRVAVVVLTGFAALDSAVQALRLGADDYLTKPCSLADIDAVLSRIAQRRRRPPTTIGTDPSRTARVADRTASDSTGAGPAASTGQTLEDLERRQILATLQRCGGNKAATARELGISLRTLYYKLSAYRAQGFIE